MQILLVTTLPNKIHEFLQCRTGLTLKVLDCSQYIAIGKNKQKFSIIKRHVLSVIRSITSKGDIDILITYRCPFVLPSDIFNQVVYGAYNVHPSLLPKYSGVNPWKDIYENKESISGVTLHAIDEGVDTGDIIFQKKFKFILDEDVNYHRKIVESLACKGLEELLLSIKKV